MYTQYFGLEKKPFSLTTDPDFFYLSNTHDMALTYLEYGLRHNVGFLALTGPVGSGKTILIKSLARRLDEEMEFTVLHIANFNAVDFLETLAKGYGIGCSSMSKSELVKAVNFHLVSRYLSGRPCVIVVDESHNVSRETMEEIRMLSNLEKGNEFIVQIILVGGQPRFREHLFARSFEQLAQRITFNYNLTNLSGEEIGEYIRHRLKIAGRQSGDDLFDGEAVELIAAESGGIPRLINILCDGCLAYSCAAEKQNVDRSIVNKILSENDFFALSENMSKWTKTDNPVLNSRNASTCGELDKIMVQTHAGEPCNVKHAVATDGSNKSESEFGSALQAGSFSFGQVKKTPGKKTYHEQPPAICENLMDLQPESDQGSDGQCNMEHGADALFEKPVKVQSVLSGKIMLPQKQKKRGFFSMLGMGTK